MLKRIVYFALIIVPVFPVLATGAEDLKPWTITVRVYSYQAPDKFPQLDSVATIIARETGKGFINSTSIFRDGFHYGATFCSLVDYRIDQAEKEKQRIVGELKDIQKDPNEVLDFEVINPSDCFETHLD